MQPVTFTPQGLFVNVPLDCNSGNVAGVFNQLQVFSRGAPRFMIIDRKGAEGLAVARKQRTRPNGTNSIRTHAVAIILPDRINQDVGHINRLPAMNRCAARTSVRTNRHRSYDGAKPRQTGRSLTMEFVSV